MYTLHRLFQLIFSTNFKRPTNITSIYVTGPFNKLPVVMSGTPDTLWITEIENIFGFPAHYTDTGNLSVRERQALLGKSWSIPVICQILLPLRNFFILKEGLN